MTGTILMYCEKCRDVKEHKECLKNRAVCKTCKSNRCSGTADSVLGLANRHERLDRTRRLHWGWRDSQKEEA